jgi:uncharacterized membrane protein YjdF
VGSLVTRERSLRKLLLGDWHPQLREPLDWARLSFAVAGVGFLLAGSLEPGLRLIFTFFVVMVVERLRVPRWADALFMFGVGLAAWGDAANLFGKVDKWDNIVHFVFPMSAVPVLYVLNVRLGLLPELAAVDRPRQRFALVLFAVMVGLSLGALYEIYEYVAYHWLSADIVIGYADTIFDLTQDALGALLGGALLWVWAANNWPTERHATRR